MKNSRLASLEREMELHLDTLSSEVTSNLIAKLDFQPITAILASSAQQESAQVRSQFLFFKKIFPIFFEDIYMFFQYISSSTSVSQIFF